MASIVNLANNIKAIIDARVMEYIEKVSVDMDIEKSKLVEIWDNIDKNDKQRKKSKASKLRKKNLYHRFCDEKRPTLKGLKFGEISKECGRLWKQEKESYIKKYNEENSINNDEESNESSVENNVEKPQPKKRGRKPKKIVEEKVTEEKVTEEKVTEEKPQPKKRGRKPKKIVEEKVTEEKVTEEEKSESEEEQGEEENLKPNWKVNGKNDSEDEEDGHTTTTTKISDNDDNDDNDEEEVYKNTCLQLNKRGGRCKYKAKNGNKFCARHMKTLPENE